MYVRLLLFDFYFSVSQSVTHNLYLSEMKKSRDERLLGVLLMAVGRHLVVA